jgi:hypothetical protein
MLMAVGLAAAGIGCVRADIKTPKNIQIGAPGGDWSPSPDRRNGSGRHLFVAYDSLSRPGRPVDLIARLRDGQGRALQGVTIGFYQGRNLLGADRTDQRGIANVSWTPPREATFSLLARVVEIPEELDEGLTRPADVPMTITALAGDAPVCLVDTRDTFFEGDFTRVIGGKRPDAAAAAAMQSVNSRYNVVYLARRPAALTAPAKRWLEKNSFPSGPVLLVSHDEVLGDAAQWKTATAEAIRTGGVNLAAGITAETRRAQRFLAAGLRTVFFVRYESDEADEMLEAAERIEDVRGWRSMEAVDHWSDVGQALARRERFPAEQLVRDLRARARRMDDD